MIKKILIITIIILSIYIILRKIENDKFVDNKNEYLIDVRSKLEWNEWHHPKAIHVPYYEIKNIEAIVKNKESKIILYCSTGRRASISRKKLIDIGYKNIEIKNIKQI